MKGVQTHCKKAHLLEQCEVTCQKSSCQWMGYADASSFTLLGPHISLAAMAILDDTLMCPTVTLRLSWWLQAYCQELGESAEIGKDRCTNSVPP